MKKTLRIILLKILPVVVVLAGAVFISKTLVQSRPKPQVQPLKNEATLVETIEANPESRRVDVVGYGNVMSARQVDITPQVSGRITRVNRDFVPGGYLKKGALIVSIDSRDYRAQLDQAQSQLKQAKTGLELERGQQKIAREEWEMMRENFGATAEKPALALREPQLKNAQAAVEAAESAVYKAKLDLWRTTVRAPFNATVISENADVGQLASSQSPLGTLVGSDEYWVMASVPAAKLSMIDLPDIEGKGGAEATVTYNTGDLTVERKGKVIRLLKDLEATGRMARLLISVDDPLGLKEGNKGLELLLNAYVKVTIEGRMVDGIYVIPRTALREGDEVWVMDDEDSLEIRKVTVVWGREDDVFIGSGLNPGDRVITSRLATPVPGMALRLDNKEDEGEEYEPMPYTPERKPE